MLGPATVHSGRLLIEEVHKSFPGPTGVLPVLRGITLDIQAGEFVSIVGGSGCGKSTLLRAVAGIEGVDSGRLLLDGSPIVRPGIDRGLVFQEHRLMPWLTVAENVAFGLNTHSDTEREAEVCIRCTDPVFQISAADGNLVAWKRQRVQLDGTCSCGAGGIVRGPTSLASSTGSRQARVLDQYLGASSM